MSYTSNSPYSVLENKAHLVFVLLLGEDLGSVWNSSNFLLNLSVTLFELSSGLLDIFFNFLLNGQKLGILLLNVQSVLQFVDFWDLSDDLAFLFLEVLNHLGVKLGWLVLLKHLIDGLLDDARLIGEVLLESVHILLDGLKLGQSEGTAHFALFSIPDALVKLDLELAYHVLISLDEALQFFLLFNECLVLCNIILVDERWQLELTEILLSNGHTIAVIQQ